MSGSLSCSSRAQNCSLSYGNGDWRDLLTAYNNQPIAYEGQTFNGSTVSGSPVSGNPISYFNGTRWEFDWAEGRQLVTATTAPDDSTELTIGYTYDLNGLRTGKTVTTRTYSTHTHNYTTTVVAPTCTTDGYTLHECACGDSYQDSTVSKLGHSWVETGRDSMYIYYRCIRCGATRKTSVITVPIDPDPPVSEYSLGDDPEPSVASTGTERTLISTVTEHHEYVYAGGKLLRETITTTAADGTVTVQVLDFTYDASGNSYALTYTNGTADPVVYYYITNLQGDVIYLVEANGDTAAEYAYDAYGKITAVSGSMAEINPLRYRGYYYDKESDFYYLQSRYYDPIVKRFLNADALASTGQGFVGCNMFAYCLNCPVNMYDDEGDIPVNIDKRIHDKVLEEICKDNKDLRCKKTCIYLNGKDCLGGWGFCDLYNVETGEVWELKKNSFSYTCQHDVAKRQLDNYINGVLKHHKGLKLEHPSQTRINDGAFIYNDGTDDYRVWYWYEGDGILRYDYVKLTRKFETTVVAALVIAAVVIAGGPCVVTTAVMVM